jgi:prephenate dehydrogenase
VAAVRATLSACGPDCVVSDVGSTKRQIAREVLDTRFVGGHPLAGAETAGVQSAREDLFDGAVWYLTPTAADVAPALSRLDGLVEQLGAKPVVLDPDGHDRLMASVSHLPHVLANLLIAQAFASLAGGVAASTTSASLIAPLGTGPSFRDATRVAGSNSAIWTDIYMSNRDELIAAIDELAGRLAQVRDALENGDADALTAWNERARADRGALLEEDSSS